MSKHDQNDRLSPYFVRSLAETAHHMSRRKLPKASENEGGSPKPPTNEVT